MDLDVLDMGSNIYTKAEGSIRFKERGLINSGDGRGDYISSSSLA